MFLWLGGTQPFHHDSVIPKRTKKCVLNFLFLLISWFILLFGIIYDKRKPYSNWIFSQERRFSCPEKQALSRMEGICSIRWDLLIPNARKDSRSSMKCWTIANILEIHTNRAAWSDARRNWNDSCPILCRIYCQHRRQAKRFSRSRHIDLPGILRSGETCRRRCVQRHRQRGWRQGG